MLLPSVICFGSSIEASNNERSCELSCGFYNVMIICQVVYRSMLETRQEIDLVTCLTERIFSVPNSVLLDATTPSKFYT